MPRLFHQIDVFSDGPFTGNPVAVVADASDLPPAWMKAVSRWTNLSECTFLLPPTDPRADYRVRIFSLDEELPFAGHPTLGSARAWLDAGGRPRRSDLVIQECGVGLVPVRVDGEHLAFAAPDLVRSGPVDAATLARVVDTLGIGLPEVVDAAWADNGPGWVAVLLASAEDVLRLEPHAKPGGDRLMIGVVGPHRPGADAAFEVRAFFPDAAGVLREDPVTGSLNASLAQWLTGSGRATAPYLVRQGTRVGHRGLVRVEQDADGLWIGGQANVIVTGVIDV